MIAFVHLNKTAGTSVKFILRNSFVLGHCDVVAQGADGIFSDVELRFAKRVFFGLQSISGHPLVHPTARLSGDIRYFTFLRDPIERCASQYQQLARGRGRRKKWWKGGPQSNKIAAGSDVTARRTLSFEEFIRREEHRNLQVRRIAGIVDLDKAKEEIERHYFFVGLTERFGESIRLLQKLCPYEIDPRYKSLKVARDNTIKRRVLDDPATRELLREANAVDQELYDYVRHFVYPAQLKKVALVDADAEDGREPQDFNPLRYQINRLYNNAVYKQALKLRKLLLRPE